ncbi:unnamed protein product [Durusdinium trenchii]
MMRSPAFAASRFAWKLKPLFHRAQWRPQSQGSLAVSLCHDDVAGVLLKPDKDLVEDIFKNQDAMLLLQRLQDLGRIHLQLQAVRFIMGEQLSKYGMDKPVEAGEGVAEQVQEKALHYVRAFKDVESMMDGLRRLLDRIRREDKEKSGFMGWIGVYQAKVKDSRKDFGKEAEKIVLPTISKLKGVGMPSADEVKKQCLTAESLFNQVMETKCLSDVKMKAYHEQLNKSKSNVEGARKEGEEADRHLQTVRKEHHRATSEFKALEEKQKRLQSDVKKGDESLSAAQVQLGEVEERVRRYTFNKFGPFVEVWRRDVDRAEKEERNKHEEITGLTKQLEQQKDARVAFAGEKAKAEAACKSAEDELKAAESKAKEAREKIDQAEDAHAKIQQKMMEQLQKKGFMTDNEALALKLMASQLHRNLKAARGQEDLVDYPFEGLVREAEGLTDEMKKAETFKVMANELTGFLDQFAGSQTFRADSKRFEIAMSLCPKLDFGKVNRLVTCGSPDTLQGILASNQIFPEKAATKTIE